MQAHVALIPAVAGFSFSYMAEKPGTTSVTSFCDTEMTASIHVHVWHPYFTKDIDKLESIQERAARRIWSQENML